MAGSALAESLHLKHTNGKFDAWQLPEKLDLNSTTYTVSQPSIQRTASQQSLAASEDFYSLSSRSSNRSNNNLGFTAPPPRSPNRPQPERYVTAREVIENPRGVPLTYQPTRPRVSYEGVATPVEVRQVQPPRITPMRGVGRRRKEDPTAEASTAIRRKPVPSTLYEESPRSSLRISETPAESSAMKAMALEPSPPTPEPSDVQYIRFALDQITNDPDERGERAPLAQSYEDKSDLGSFPFEHDKDSPLRSHPVYPRNSASPPIPARNSRRSMTRSPEKTEPPPPANLLLPFDRPMDSFYEPLTALPSTLRPLPLSLFILALTLFVICLLFCAIWSRTRTELWDYGSLGDGKYFIWQYLPTMLGMLLLLWLFEIESAVYRLAPFLALSARNSVSRSYGVFLPLSPSNFLLPTFAHLKAGQPIITIFLFSSWLNLLTIPLLGSSFNVYFREGRWVWLATQGVVWSVVALYVMLLVAAAVLLFHLHGRQTGLKWDARSLADLITLVQASNTLDNYANYPLITGEDEVRENIAEREDGLGYFHSSLRPSEVFHTLGSPNMQTRRAANENVRRSDNTSSVPRYSSQFIDPESGRPYSEYSNFTHNTTDPVLPHDMAASWQSHIPWFMRTSLVALWLIIALVLLVAFLIVSYLPSTRVMAGFRPDLSVIQGNFGFSATNFFYSFIPSLLGLLCLLVWQPFDLAFRRLQPYASLSNPGGEFAEKSLLLSYTADAPVIITIQAAVNSHFRTALMSVVSLIAATFPILGGGVFWSQFSVSQQRVNVYADMPAYYALTVFFTIYCLSYAMVFPGKLRRIPNKGRCLADVIAFVHQSKILEDPEFHAPASKIALVTRLISPRASTRISTHDHEKRVAAYPETEAGAAGSKVSLADSLRGIGQARREARAETRFSGGSMQLVQPKYGFGRYIGRDGREWLGIDKIGRPGRGGEMVVRE